MSSSPVVCPQTHLRALRSLCPRAFGALLSARTYRLRSASPRAHAPEFLSTIHHAPGARWSGLLPIFVLRLSRAVRVSSTDPLPICFRGVIEPYACTWTLSRMAGAARQVRKPLYSFTSHSLDAATLVSNALKS